MKKKKQNIVIFNSFMLFCDVMRISSLFGYGDREVQLAKFILKYIKVNAKSFCIKCF